MTVCINEVIRLAKESSAMQSNSSTCIGHKSSIYSFCHKQRNFHCVSLTRKMICDIKRSHWNGILWDDWNAFKWFLCYIYLVAFTFATIHCVSFHLLNVCIYMYIAKRFLLYSKFNRLENKEILQIWSARQSLSVPAIP